VYRACLTPLVPVKFSLRLSGKNDYDPANPAASVPKNDIAPDSGKTTGGQVFISETELEYISAADGTVQKMTFDDKVAHEAYHAKAGMEATRNLDPDETYGTVGEREAIMFNNDTIRKAQKRHRQVGKAQLPK
jgi:hypothetical protein